MLRRLARLALPLISLLCGFVGSAGGGEKSTALTENIARNYAAAWARKVHADIGDLKSMPDGGFAGMLGSLGFQYFPQAPILAVRAYIFPHDAEVTRAPDLLPWLNDIAAHDPDGVSHGVFETVVGLWEPDKEPSLFLRIDLSDGSQSTSAVLARLVKLREDSVVWRRTKLTEAMGELVKKERAEKATRSE